MKKLFALTAIALATLSQAAEAKDTGPYLQGSVYGTDLDNTELHIAGGANANYDSDIGYGLGVEGGYKFNQYFRAGIEAAYRHNNVNASGGLEGKFNSTAVLANGYVDIPTGTKITPYIGAGAGYAYVTDTDEHDTTFAYQGMAGLSYAATETTDVVLGYKYLGTKDPEYTAAGITIRAPYRVHNVELGLRYKF